MLDRRTALKSLFSTAVAAGALARGGAAQAEAPRPNVVVIVCDDLNCAISPYAPEQKLRTPSFERLQAMGAMFEHAYAAVPACSPSRTALFLGVEPTSSGIYLNTQSWQDADPGAPENVFARFRRSGWQVLGTGKLFHGAGADLRASDWSDYWLPDAYSPRLEDIHTDIADGADGSFDFGPSETAAAPDEECAGWAVDRIAEGRLDRGGVLLALGITRPHLPFQVPQEWFDRYPAEVELPPGYWPGARSHEENVADQADLGRKGLRRAASDPVADALTEHDELNDFLRAYYAAVSFADAQVGRVLDALQARGLMENTYVVVTSDHGFMLGEKRQFTKFELREVALQVPLFVAGPGIAPRSVAAPVSLVDLYPTLCSLAGLLPPPACEGQDLAPTLRSGAVPPRGHASSWFGVRASGDAVQTLQVYASVRTDGWRLIDYGPSSNMLRRMLELGAREAELYDHDPASPGYDPHEWHNVADAHPDVVAALRALLPSLEAPEVAITASLAEEHG